MHPYLFDLVIAGHHIRPPTYGLMLAISFSFAYFEALRRARKLNEDPKHIENLFLLIVVGSILGSRLFHVFFEDFNYYAEHPFKVFAIWEGGYTFYGAVIVATIFIFGYCRKEKINFLEFADISTPSAALGLFFGRIGCFLAGCCWGRPTTLPWGVTFRDPESFAAMHDVPLHPTQLYESFGALLLFFYLILRFRHRKYLGQIFFEGLAIYSLLRFGIEYFRGDDYRGYVFGGHISYSQLVSLFILPFAVIGIFMNYRRRLKNSSLRTK
jgi:phosphatidylglycerol---prolipoprotein diacylglyceryl transferase